MSDRAPREPLSDDERAARDADLLRLAGRLARFGGWSIEVPSGELYWSAELFTMLDFEPTAGAPPLDVAMGLYPERYRVAAQEALDRCVADGTPMDFEASIADRNGRELRVRTLGEAVRDRKGTITRVQGAFYDVTEIVTEREERIAAQEGLRTTLDYIPDVVCFVDESWRMTFANAATVALTGMSATELASDTIWALFPELTTTSLRPIYERAMNERVSGTARDYIEQVGSWLEVTVHPTAAGIAIFAKDVSEDEARLDEIAEVSVRAQEQAALLDASNEAMIMEDLDNNVTYWNQGAEQIYGWTREEAVGRNIRDLVYSDSTVFDGPAAALLRDGRWHGEMVQQAKDGRTLIIECRWQAVIGLDGRPEKLFAVNSDVTQQRREREIQVRAQRMESLGTLAGGIAHDLNNVLTPLLMSAQLMRSQQVNPDHTRLLAGMEVGIRRGADMIRQVLTFARGAESVHGYVDIAEVVDELTTMSLQTLPKSISVSSQVDGRPMIEGDRTQVLQVLMNLVTNARDAMPDGGELTVLAGRERVDETFGASESLTTGDYVVITVEDSGQGMPADVLDRIFEPFFTTKPVGEGTGLGLASSIAIAKSHRGAITARSEPGVGSQFAVYLPLADDQSQPTVEPAPDIQELAGSGQLVLVVDDEEAVRQSVRRTLEAHGYRTLEAAHGREAIEVFEGHADDVALMLTDMMMPVMDGAATAAYFLEHHPQVGVVAASGYDAGGGVARATHSGVQHFVAKPFTTETLLRALRAALPD